MIKTSRSTSRLGAGGLRTFFQFTNSNPRSKKTQTTMGFRASTAYFILLGQWPKNNVINTLEMTIITLLKCGIWAGSPPPRSIPTFLDTIIVQTRKKL